MGQNLNLRLLDLARFHIGINETGGDNKGPIIEEFQRAVDGKASGEPWCMAFIQHLANKTAQAHRGIIRLHKSEGVLVTWNKTMPAARVFLPTPGCIVLWQHGTTSMGHCGVVSEVLGDKFLTIEGNTSGLGTGIVREGDGIYIKQRPWDTLKKESTVGDMKLLGFLNVF